MKYLLIAIMVGIVLWGVVALLSFRKEDSATSGTELPPVLTGKDVRTVALYFYDEKRDRDSSGALSCSKAGLVPVSRAVASTSAIVSDTLELLLSGNISNKEREAGLSTGFPLSGVTLQQVAVENATATIAIRDPEHKTSGGACRASLLRLQVEETVRQFSSIKNVVITPEDAFQP